MRIAMPMLLVITLAFGAASVWEQGPLLLDVSITRALQQVIAAKSVWIDWLALTAGWPGIVITALAAAVFAASLKGLRGASAALIGMALAMAAERALRLFVSVPRPSSELVEVAKASVSSGVPSTFAIFYGAACGALVMLAWNRRGSEAAVVRWAASALLIIGCTARVAAGAHWTSQVIASVALGWLASAIALQGMNVRR